MKPETDPSLDALVKKMWAFTAKSLNPDDIPEAMTGTRAEKLSTEFMSKIGEYTFEELFYALYAAMVLTAVAMDEKLNPMAAAEGITVDQVIDMMTEIGDEDLLRVWFALGQQPVQERSTRLVEAARAEFVKRGMPCIPLSEI